MDLMELIRKAASGGELDEREIEFVKSCRPGGGSGELEARNAELAERLHTEVVEQLYGEFHIFSHDLISPQMSFL